MADGAEVVGAGSWRNVDLPGRVAAVPTMLSADESRLLYGLARDGYQGQGRIVDGGCFLGGSTVALAQGLRDGGHDGRIDVYDRFRVEGYTTGWFDGLAEGDSFRHLFDQHLAGFDDLLDVHEGDISRQRFDAPIELLFLDVLKSWRVNDVITAATFSRPVPEAVVVQQDWGAGSLPWVTLTMERLAPWFEVLADVGSSRVYVLREPIPDEVLRVRWNDLDPRWMVAAHERVVDSLEGTAGGLQMVNLACLLMRVSDPPRGRAMLEDVARSHSDDPTVLEAVELARSWSPRWLVPLMWLDVAGRNVGRRGRALRRHLRTLRERA